MPPPAALPPLAALLALAAACGALQTETVQRVVLLRTSGSDLAPAASGYIYSKRGDGRESVVEMAESEIMQRLAELRERPAGAAASSAEDSGAGSEERVIPVKENAEEGVEADGVADVDYEKMFADHSGERAYDDYLKSLKRYKDDLRVQYAGDDKGSNGRGYGEGDAGGYHNAKFESYSTSGGRKKSHDDDDHKKYHDGPHGGSNDAALGKEDDDQGFRKIYDKDNYEYFDKGVKAFPDQHRYYGAGGSGYKYIGSEPKDRDATAGVAERGPAAAPAHARAAERPAPADGAYAYHIEH